MNLSAMLRGIQDEIDRIEKERESKMIKGQTLKMLTAEMAAREAEAYACDPQGGYGPGHCGHTEHKALRYAAFRRNHPSGLKAPREGRA